MTTASTSTPRPRDGQAAGDGQAFAQQLVGAWGSWGPSMTPDAGRVAFLSDRAGSPEVWVQEIAPDGAPTEARPV
ncbi:MAG: hypothetical protein Q7T71_19365, partial [Herbiconiux sp.]|nr:hypothetical protein [Herbiconiux sp.]